MMDIITRGRLKQMRLTGMVECLERLRRFPMPRPR